jgi:hypothetical protein
MQDEWHLDEYQKSFDAELARKYIEQDKSEDEILEFLPDLYEDALKKVSDSLFLELEERAPAMLREHRTLRRGFVRRNCARWQRGFDLLERLIVISQETGSAINTALRPSAVDSRDAVFEAIIPNHARAVQISREILTLMMAGFPDGALGRWRTLHEIAVISLFISEHGQPVAERYVLQDQVTAWRRAKNYMEHHERANLQPVEKDVLDRLEANSEEIISRYGDNMKSDYGWASPVLNKEKPLFADLEKATKLDHWRPRYKWATQNTHGSYRSLGSTLATCESERPVLAVGESNSGMTDPAHMTAISLNAATLPVIMLEPNLDRLAVARISDRLSDEIGEAFFRLDRETRKRAREKR